MRPPLIRIAVGAAMRVGSTTAPRFAANGNDLDECLLHAKQWRCPHCGKEGMLVGHGRLVGYAEDGTYPVVRGRRFFCSNRFRRRGCGGTFSVLVEDAIRGFVVRALTLFAFAAAVVAGATRKAAWERAARGAFSLTSGYRLWRRLRDAQVHLRTRLSAIGPPPASSSTASWGQLLEHFRAALSSADCPFVAFQRELQVALFG